MEYEVGKFYLVKCAELSNGKVIYFVPIIGEPHFDKQFGVDFKHYHVDCRFTNKDLCENFSIEEGRTNTIICTDSTLDNKVVFPFKRVVYKKKKCVRLDTGIIAPTTKIGERTGKYLDWKKTMIGKSCKGRKCPHLGTTMIDFNGKLLCPLHNLIGCKETEVIIPN